MHSHIIDNSLLPGSCLKYTSECDSIPFPKAEVHLNFKGWYGKRGASGGGAFPTSIIPIRKTWIFMDQHGAEATWKANAEPPQV